jgi:hypothetical protein
MRYMIANHASKGPMVIVRMEGKVGEYWTSSDQVWTRDESIADMFSGPQDGCHEITEKEALAIIDKYAKQDKSKKVKVAYLVDKIMLKRNSLTLLRRKGNTYSCACKRTDYEWEDALSYSAPFSGMDDDFADISEEDALILLKNYKGY